MVVITDDVTIECVIDQISLTINSPHGADSSLNILLLLLDQITGHRKDWESFGTNPARADLRRKPSNRSRWAEFVNPHHDGDAYCNFEKNSRFKY